MTDQQMEKILSMIEKVTESRFVWTGLLLYLGFIIGQAFAVFIF